MLFKNILCLFVVLSFQRAFASDLEFTNIDKSDLDKVVEDLSATFMHTTVSPASALGNIFGIEVGLFAGANKTPGIQSLAKEVDASNDISAVPMASAFAAVSVPFGITAEVSVVPSFDTDYFKLKSQGVALKWTLTEGLLVLPINLAVKVAHTSSTFSFDQTVGGNTSKIEYEGTSTQFLLMGGVNLLIVEPYLGIGTVSADGELKTTAGTNIFDSAFTASTSASSKPNSSIAMAGVNVSLLLIKLGLEYTHAFNSDRYLAKFSLKF